MSEDLTGRRLGHYRIDGVLGRGGMSVMYKATDVRLGRKVALKVIGEHLGEDAEFRERFVDEARNTSAIDHANVVPLYDFGEVDGLLYIAMRLVDGSDLASIIRNGPITPERTLSLLGQVAEALDTLHDRGLVHLDVKPANVLVTSRETSTEHVYLADFGLTRRGATGHRTRSGDFLGSPTYAAPEHLRGEPVDARTDAYSLACVLFACLTGRPPFQGKVPEVIQGHLNLDPPAVTGLVALPGAIDEVIRRGMAKDSKVRYVDCKALIGAARQALQQAPRREVPRPAVAPQPPQQQYRPPQQQQPPQVPQQPQQQPPAPGDFVRLRPPTPVGSSAFTSDKGSKRWLVPVLVGLVAIAAIVLIIVLVSGGGDNSDPQQNSTVPQIPVGEGSGTPTKPKSTTPSTRRTLPSNLTVIPSGS
ncbi:serine/threonine protein kinase [Kibdelosporangium philippinense]|uniref:non-specific serine/threonine protein kinase n=1 Tax=Kibdelosporangium philippinense TaxID=211113 RepID=A0ABS8ZN32_9PSEU|nr:serine/threonine-protein kinase [Kibdelosporangium philippinense]MCE7009125.1 serine/threonine protein kinase [Kibdelosporangium philippinense]